MQRAPHARSENCQDLCLDSGLEHWSLRDIPRPPWAIPGPCEPNTAGQQPTSYRRRDCGRGCLRGA
eukprot:8964946-Alexandrium_andersonii.AAC.1